MSKMETEGLSDCPKLYGDAARVRGGKRVLLYGKYQRNCCYFAVG